MKAEEGKPRRKRRVDSLCRLKGIDVMTAADLAFEAGEFSRFKNARSFAAWAGLTPSEHSSGESVRKGGATKAGNKHLRKNVGGNRAALSDVLRAFEGPRQRTGSEPSGQKACDQGHTKTRDEAGVDAGTRDA